jgi:S1-C subfamily serine protease
MWADRDYERKGAGGRNMESVLAGFSNEVAKIVTEASPNVVAVHARPHLPSSGVQWRPALIVTAGHTVRREEEIQVTLADGKMVTAAFAGKDRGTDLALLRVEGLATPTLTTRADSTHVGELALVLGRSPNSGPNVALGIISAVSGPWKTWRGGQLDQYIRLDATLFPASSGGAVVDIYGKVIGIATSALSRIAGLAIPAATVNRVVDVLLQRGASGRGYLGVALQTVAIPEGLRTQLSVANRSGALIVHVGSGSPAEEAGLLIGDILVGLDGKAIEMTEDLQSYLDAAATGKKVTAKFLRGGKPAEASIAIRARSQTNG